MFFGRKKTEEKNNNIIEDPVLGKMEYINTWWSVNTIEITLFGENRSIKYFAASNDNKEVPNQIQRDSFKNFLERKSEIIPEVEKILREQIKSDGSFDITDILDVAGIYLSRDGKCGLSLEILEEYLDEIDLDELGITPDQCFGLSLIPDIFLIKSGDIFDEMFH